MFRIAYDVKAHKVGCVIIQAAMGGTVPSELFNRFFGNSESWTVDIGDCAVYNITEEQLPQLAARTDFRRR